MELWSDERLFEQTQLVNATARKILTRTNLIINLLGGVPPAYSPNLVADWNVVLCYFPIPRSIKH
jgi:hypothetical protein